MPTRLRLLDPLSLNNELSFTNRIVLAPMTRGRSGPSRRPNALNTEYYVQRASAGLLITEGVTISEQANGWNGNPGIYEPAMVEGWRNLVSAVHAAGGRIFCQLWHCGRASHSSFHDGLPPVAASAVRMGGDGIHTPTGKQSLETPRALSLPEIPAVVEQFREAAAAARDAGFDGIEIHGANGYLIDGFLQSRTNQRSDAYGGSVSARFRFLEEVVDAATAEWPVGRVGVRLSPNGNYNDMGSPDFREQFFHAAARLSTKRLAYLHVVDGLAFGFHELGPAVEIHEVKKHFGGPVIANCGYERDSAERAISSGYADAVSFGRPFISNPDLVDRFTRDLPLAPAAPTSDWFEDRGTAGYTDFPTASMAPAPSTAG